MLTLALTAVLAAKTTTVPITFPPTAPWRGGKFIITTDTFAGPLPFSPIGGPDAEATVELELTGGPRVVLHERHGLKSDWPQFKAYRAGKLTLDVWPSGEGFGWCTAPCTTRSLVWFIDGTLSSCVEDSSAPRRALPLRALLLEVAEQGPRHWCLALREQAVPWLLKRAPSGPDEKLELALAHWLAAGASPEPLREQVIAWLRPRLPKSRAADVLVRAWEQSVKERGANFQLLDELTAGLPGRPAAPTLLLNPVLRTGGKPRGRIEFWNPDTRTLVTAADFEGDVAGLTPPPGVFGAVLVKAPGMTTRQLWGRKAPGHQGEVVLEPADRVLELSISRAGAPVANVDVRVVDTILIEPKERVVASGRTDATGRLRLAGVSQNALLVEVRPPGGECDEVAVKASNAGGKPLERVDLALDQRSVYRNRVLSSAGQPVPGLRLRARAFNSVSDCAVREATTDAKGEFVMYGLRPDVSWEFQAGATRLGSLSLKDDRPLRKY